MRGCSDAFDIHIDLRFYSWDYCEIYVDREKMKTEIEYFRDWESNVFGFGYGSGEKYILPAVKSFLVLCQRDGLNHAYDYEVLERKLNPTVAWLLITALCNADIIEYGTSPRYGWLTNKGIKLREFASRKPANELVEICTNYDENYIHCYPDHCNCDDEKCNNPFWEKG